MVRAGFELSARLLSFPTPVMVAYGGHAIAIGVFLTLSGDYRIGVPGPYKYTANEVAIGITMPRTAIAQGVQRFMEKSWVRATPRSPQETEASVTIPGFLGRRLRIRGTSCVRGCSVFVHRVSNWLFPRRKT